MPFRGLSGLITYASLCKATWEERENVDSCPWLRKSTSISVQVRARLVASHGMNGQGAFPMASGVTWVLGSRSSGPRLVPRSALSARVFFDWLESPHKRFTFVIFVRFQISLTRRPGPPKICRSFLLERAFLD